MDKHIIRYYVHEVKYKESKQIKKGVGRYNTRTSEKHTRAHARTLRYREKERGRGRDRQTETERTEKRYPLDTYLTIFSFFRVRSPASTGEMVCAGLGSGRLFPAVKFLHTIRPQGETPKVICVNR